MYVVIPELGLDFNNSGWVSQSKIYCQNTILGEIGHFVVHLFALELWNFLKKFIAKISV